MIFLHRFLKEKDLSKLERSRAPKAMIFLNGFLKEMH